MKKVISTIMLFSLLACSEADNEITFIPSSSPESTQSETATSQSRSPKSFNLKNVRSAEQKHLRTIKLESYQVIHLTGVVDSRIDNLIYRLNKMNDDRKVKEIYLLIDSPGGSVMDGARFVSAMQASRKPVNTVCMSLCASMAAVIHQYGTTRLMLDRSTLMFHDASGGFQGTLPQIATRLAYVTGIVNKMDAFIASRSHITLHNFLQEIQSEIWVDSDDALARHFDDEIVYVYVEDEAQPTDEMLNTDNQFKKYNLDLT
jgi:ATP-dependent Clp protease, protease subunit